MSLDHKSLMRWLRDQGLIAGTTGSGHVKVQTPAGIYFMSSSPSDRRSCLNVCSALRRRGVNVPR